MTVAAPRRSYDAVAEIFEVHLRLDAAVDHTLSDLIANTESSAVASIKQVRRLYDSAAQLGTAIGGTGIGAEGPDENIESNLAQPAKVGTFIEKLPARMQRDLHSAKVVVKEISELNRLVADVQSISMQSQEYIRWHAHPYTEVRGAPRSSTRRGPRFDVTTGLRFAV